MCYVQQILGSSNRIQRQAKLRLYSDSKILSHDQYFVQCTYETCKLCDARGFVEVNKYQECMGFQRKTLSLKGDVNSVGKG